MISTVTTTATTFFPHLFQQFIGRARQLLVLRAQQGAEVAQGEGVEEEHLPRWTRQRRVTPTAATGDTWRVTPVCRGEVRGSPWSAAEAVSVGPRAPTPQICEAERGDIMKGSQYLWEYLWNDTWWGNVVKNSHW